MGALARCEGPVYRRRQHLGDVGRGEPDLDHSGAGALYRRQHEAAAGNLVRLRRGMNELTPAESRDLRCIAGMMIPASSEYDVPGADDATIFADITGTMGRDIPHVREALATLTGLADLDPAKREAAVLALRSPGGIAAATLSRGRP